MPTGFPDQVPSEEAEVNLPVDSMNAAFYMLKCSIDKHLE